MLSVLTWTVLAWAFRKTVQRSLREQLVDRGVPICINCGYDVRGSKDRCPECATRVQKKGLTMSAKLFIQNIAQLDEAVKLCLEKRLQLPALILIYSWIDIMGWLNCDDSAEKSRTSFTRWVNEFLLPAKPLPCNADELWGARCGLIHRMSPSSDLSDRGKVRQIAYAWGHADVDTLQRGILLTKMNNNLTAVHLSDLLEGVCLGSFANTQALEKNPPQEAAFFSRVEQFFANIPSEMMDEFTEREATEPENPH